MNKNIENKNTVYQEYVSEILFGEKGSFKRRVYEYVKYRPALYKKFTELMGHSLGNISKIPNICNAKKILELGCGPGICLNYIHNFINKNAEFLGLDRERSPMLAEYIRFSEADMEKGSLPYDDDSMDVVLITFVLEHLHDPLRLFSEVYRVLRKGGYIYLVTENVSSLFGFDYYNFYSDPTHIRPYTKLALLKLSQMANFEVQETATIRHPLFFLLAPLLPILDLILKTKTTYLFFSELTGAKLYLIAKKR